jgi:DNA-binding transcriptional ArsR family regulator
MGDVGKKLCQDGGVDWLDLSGNANISAPGMRVRIEGLPNQHKYQGRSSNLFTPASSRLARVLLLNPERRFTQKQLAEEADLDIGTVSTRLRRYEDAGFVAREGPKRGAEWKLAKGSLLLDAWHEAYDFRVHDVRRGHIVARTGEELLGRIARELEARKVEYAATGLAGAWLLEPFAMFRLITLYVRTWPPADLLEMLHFDEGPRGANVWLVLPRDQGVFYGGGVHDGIRHVSAVQVYLDLKAQPERSEEAAEQLRSKQLTWSGDDG